MNRRAPGLVVALTFLAVAPVPMKIRGANGGRIEAIYELVWESDRWKIAGVVSRPDDEVV